MYVGTNNLHQLPEAASVAQIIINSNYTDEQDDYDIALLRLAKPLALSGERRDQGGPGPTRCPTATGWRPPAH